MVWPTAATRNENGPPWLGFGFGLGFGVRFDFDFVGVGAGVPAEVDPDEAEGCCGVAVSVAWSEPLVQPANSTAASRIAAGRSEVGGRMVPGTVGQPTGPRRRASRKASTRADEAAPRVHQDDAVVGADLAAMGERLRARQRGSALGRREDA